MQRIYGYRWSSQYGEADDGTWSAGLREFSETEIFVAIQACVDSTEKWPPGLPEFRALCRPVKRENEAMYRMPPDRQLPHLLSEEARSSGRAAIAALRSKVKA
jgi:hypothetical protein